MKVVLLVAVTALAYAEMRVTNANVTPFDSVDINLDGTIDFAEFERWHKKKLGLTHERHIRETFRRFDSNKDNLLELAEFVPLAYEISQKPLQTAQQIFAHLDLNADDVIDAAELAKARKDFDQGIVDGVLSIADVNRDGKLTREEFDAQLNYTKPKTQEEQSRETAFQLLTFIDKNEDSKLTEQEIFEFANQYNEITKPEISKVVSALDKNGDGVLDLSELQTLPAVMIQMLNIRAPPTL